MWQMNLLEQNLGYTNAQNKDQTIMTVYANNRCICQEYML